MRGCSAAPSPGRVRRRCGSRGCRPSSTSPLRRTATDGRHDARDVDREPRRRGRTGLAAAGGVVDRPRRLDVAPRGLLGRDVHELRPVHRDDDLVPDDPGLDVDAVAGVVAEAVVDAAPVDRGLPALGVAGDVERVRFVLDLVEAAEEHRVEQRGGQLRDAAAVVVDEPAAGDDGRAVEPAFGRALPDGVVEGELLPRRRIVPSTCEAAMRMFSVRPLFAVKVVANVEMRSVIPNCCNASVVSAGWDSVSCTSARRVGCSPVRAPVTAFARSSGGAARPATAGTTWGVSPTISMRASCAALSNCGSAATRAACNPAPSATRAAFPSTGRTARDRAKAAGARVASRPPPATTRLPATAGRATASTADWIPAASTDGSATAACSVTGRPLSHPPLTARAAASTSRARPSSGAVTAVRRCRPRARRT